MRRFSLAALGFAAAGAAVGLAGAAWAQDAAALKKTLDALQASAADLKVAADTIWVLVTAFLVFWMNAGFAMVETGLCRSKNAVAVLYKNFAVFAASSLAFWAVGFAIMFGNGTPLFGLNGWFIGGADNSPAMGGAYKGVFSALNWTGVPLYAKFFFQLVFAGTAATIVSGCVAERIHFASFMLFSFLLVGILYPVGGHWVWGGGWLATMGMLDFAGSTVVHSIGGWAGLAGIIILGPRIGKYGPDGRMNPILGHQMGYVALGGLILWLGWFGFNPGSTMAAAPADIARIALTTNMAAAAAILTSSITSRYAFGKADLSMSVNGALAGLVAITAPCAFVTPAASVVIGAIAGVLVCYSVPFFDKIKIDDPVGALSVHLVCGIFGTLAVGIWANPAFTPEKAAGLLWGGGLKLFLTQLTGAVAVGAFVFIGSLVMWYIVRAVVGLRVDPEAELSGLDLSEHGMEAYAAEKIVR
ncbi:MAG: ammonia permease [Candidatus Tectomicrobia bacterium RIFCSPLOWO2_12_FULL_69_37]|nr:MAG: ammonia permease [Candidatus Tectomicrobia bacterium RIFCSPLOWO2_02_FULL_70_19]OGL59415.1 MAG: ammonia permease [Candidatus Tectomicrobia bacterium RIFCSPLOWO2_12_FULL_69_37]